MVQKRILQFKIYRISCDTYSTFVVIKI